MVSKVSRMLLIGGLLAAGVVISDAKAADLPTVSAPPLTADTDGGDPFQPPGGPGFKPPFPMPPPAKGMVFRIKRGDTEIDIKCADDESSKVCVESATQLLANTASGKVMIGP